MKKSDNLSNKVEVYYDALLKKDFVTMEGCLHPDVHFIGPLAEMRGRENVLGAAKRLSAMLDNIVIRSKFNLDNQVMLAYDLFFVAPIGKLRAAVLMTFKDSLIASIELFYDGRPFVQKKDEIFSNNKR